MNDNTKTLKTQLFNVSMSVNFLRSYWTSLDCSILKEIQKTPITFEVLICFVVLQILFWVLIKEMEVEEELVASVMYLYFYLEMMVVALKIVILIWAQSWVQIN